MALLILNLMVSSGGLAWGYLAFVFFMAVFLATFFCALGILLLRKIGAQSA